MFNELIFAWYAETTELWATDHRVVQSLVYLLV